MKIALNIFESILLTFAILLTVICMTILNKRYVKFTLDRVDYYYQVVNEINNEIEYEHTIDEVKVKNDINNYIDNYYSDRSYTNKIESNVDLTDYYNTKIKFIGPFTNFQLKKDIIDVCTIIIIVIIGLLFMKTKFKHNIKLICIISGLLGILCSFILYINSYDGILHDLIRGTYYIYLGVNILLLLYPLFKKVYLSIVNKKK